MDFIDSIREDTNRLVRSHIHEIFTPHIPISNMDFLQGRKNEIRKLFQILTTPGQHALLYGERGVGKSSLAQVAISELSKPRQVQVFKKSCVRDDSFMTIFVDPLKHVGVNIFKMEKSSKVGLGVSLFCASVEGNRDSREIGEAEKALSPSFVFDKIKDTEALFLIDEFDVVNNSEEKAKLSELLKLLSDYNSKFKILIVGIAECARDLTEGHPSLTRCVQEVKLRRMSLPELADIIKHGQALAHLNFNKVAISKIVFVSSGYPYFTHLLALKASEDAILNNKTEITLEDVLRATEKAAQDSEGILKNCYENALMHRNRESYERILLAAATCNEEGFSKSDWIKKIKEIYKDDVNIHQMDNVLNNIVSDDNSKILRRLYKGRYRFSDPRMPSFIKISKAYLTLDDE